MLTLSAIIPKRFKQAFGGKPSDEKEFTFIWYFKFWITKDEPMYHSAFKSFTKPVRTKIKAASYDEAKEKLTAFANTKIALQVFTEEGYKNSEQAKFDKDIKSAMDSMNKVFDNLDI